ncbi:MAG TPA: hypothetical protein VGS28_01585 [Candidatus Saccharimonadales bacterium]|nr:hypothetical protein [Candidatus Saccharimonadales bacterium]
MVEAVCDLGIEHSWEASWNTPSRRLPRVAIERLSIIRARRDQVPPPPSSALAYVQVRRSMYMPLITTDGAAAFFESQGIEPSPAAGVGTKLVSGLAAHGLIEHQCCRSRGRKMPPMNHFNEECYGCPCPLRVCQLSGVRSDGTSTVRVLHEAVEPASLLALMALGEREVRRFMQGGSIGRTSITHAQHIAETIKRDLGLAL